MERVNENMALKLRSYIPLWTLSYLTCITNLFSFFCFASSFLSLTLPIFVTHTLLSLTSFPSPSSPLSLSLSLTSDRKVVRPLKKKWQGWNGTEKNKTKLGIECRWFNQGSVLSIRHYTDGERASERHRRTETDWEREREWEEVNEREILQNCRRKKKGKEGVKEVRLRVTRCYGGRTSESGTGRR